MEFPHSRSVTLARYGMTRADYEAMLEAQDGRCAICREEPTKRLLDVDHNHVTGDIRGLLCRACNAKLGRLECDLHLKPKHREWRGKAFAYLLGDRPQVHVGPIPTAWLLRANRIPGGKP